MKSWQQVLTHVLNNGEERNDRTGVGTLATFAEKIEFDNCTTFPAVTLKKLAFKSMAGKLAGFLNGKHTIKDFNDFGCKIWDANGTADYWKPRFEGDLGRIYGVQWKDWKSIDRNGNCTL